MEKTLRQGPIVFGDRVQLTDIKGNMHTIVLEEKGHFHTHKGSFAHAELVGLEEGSVFTTNRGRQFLVMRPLLSDYTLSMPRGAAIIYPKDTGQIVQLADIFPGATVIESGVGSGALTMSLLRAIGPSGQLTSIEIRPDFAEIARANVNLWFDQEMPQWDLRLGAACAVMDNDIAPASTDRVILDMLAPWENLDAAARVLRPGGVFLAYVATTTQLSRLAEEMRDCAWFTEPRAWETLVRDWHLEGLAVRPEHRMIGHSGFLLVARRLATQGGGLNYTRRPAKGAYDFAQEWNEEDYGLHDKSARRLKRMRRELAARTGLSPLTGEEDA